MEHDFCERLVGDCSYFKTYFEEDDTNQTRI